MAAGDIEAEIDRLYQLPLDDFTSARNTLARQASGADRSRIKTLTKPHVAAWAVNQLYWRARQLYQKLVTAADHMRTAHRVVISGRSADIHGADVAHHAALREALGKTVEIVYESGRSATEATRRAISRTLEALPTDDRPGRLTHPLEPAGLALLKGVTPAPQAKVLTFAPTKTRVEPAEAAKRSEAVSREKRAAAQKAVAEAHRRLRDAREHASGAEAARRRAEVELARARAATRRARVSPGKTRRTPLTRPSGRSPIKIPQRRRRRARCGTLKAPWTRRQQSWRR